MNNLKPHIPLSSLAKAVADYDGRILNPKSESDRAELLEIAADILENPMENAELLDILSCPNESSPALSPAWSRPGEMAYLATVDITPELELLLDDIDDSRTHDLLGRELESHNVPEADVVVTQRNSKFIILASPDFLGFEQEPTRDFNRKAFKMGLNRAHRDLKKHWLVLPYLRSK
ncbi:hypothetical protein [Pseudomonas putida]|uniref:hypothetical protein n=1 Tax=Pseudomonas putida TaxID=303 RepID=UPI001F5280A6|nr:hypothetical protein [Pseudomonas putida]MCI1037999.1 hypothetical protein [Pseudomonas putida]